MIHRGQILIRESGLSSPSYDAPYDKALEYRQDYIGIGIAEVPADEYPEHIVRGFASSPGHDFAMTDFQRPLHPDMIAYAIDFGDYVRSNIWPRPHPMLGAGGGLMFRDTRMPANDGRKIVIVLMVMSLKPGTLLNHHMYGLSGAIGGWTADDTCWGRAASSFQLDNPTDAKIEQGHSFGQLMKLPIWGWGEEKVGFTSTLDLQTIDQCNRINELCFKSPLSDEEAGEIERLKRTPAWQILQHKDEEYARFRQRLVGEIGIQPWDRVRTASEMQRESEIANAIIRDLLNKDQVAA